MITDPKEALDYVNKHRKGRIADLEKVIDTETIKSHQTVSNLFVDFRGNYNFTRKNRRNYKFIYGGKMNLLDKTECFFKGIGLSLYEFISGDKIK